MEYELGDSSGTDDDLPPVHNHPSRVGRVSTLSSVQNGMETQIHRLQKEAYCSVLRAFKAQSSDITWEQESLITELRKELRVSGDEHRDILSRVNGDDLIGRIREWRSASSARHGNGELPISKRRKSSLSVSTSPLEGPSPAMRKCDSMSASRSMKRKHFSSTIPAEGTQGVNRGLYELAEGATSDDPYIGKTVWIRWPEDDNFYEAKITKYDPVQEKHVLLYDYDINSSKATWELVDLKEISPEDIRWESEDAGVSHKDVHPKSGRGVKRPLKRAGRVSGAGRGRGRGRGIRNVLNTQMQNDNGMKAPGEIKLLHTETLVKEVEKIFNASQPDPRELRKAKRVLNEHEQALVDAIAMLEDVSDDESDG